MERVKYGNDERAECTNLQYPAGIEGDVILYEKGLYIQDGLSSSSMLMHGCYAVTFENVELPHCNHDSSFG